MYRVYVSVIVLMLCLSGIITQSAAFDGKRRGFILGGAVGSGITSYSGTIDIMGMQMTTDRENKFSIATNFMLGGGLSDNLLLYYTNKVSWFSTEDEIAVFGLSGLGLSYYVDKRAPSPIIKGGLGLSSFMAPFEPEYEDYWGFGFSFGAGYEFSPHWSVEADVIMGWPSYEEWEVSLRLNVISIQVGFSGVAY